MQLRQLMLSLTFLTIVTHIGEVSKNQAIASSLTNTATSASSITASTANVTKSAKPTNVKSGTFVSGEHPTQGTVRLVTKNGKSSLELDRTFKTSDMGPDLVVILHKSDNVIGSTKPPAYPLKEGDYTILAPLKKFSGAQSYAIPEGVNLANYKSAVIWCRKFNATFGAAKLSN